MSSTAAASPRPARPSAVTLDVRTLLAGVVLALAGLGVWFEPSLDERLFHIVNDLGPRAPAFWSCLSVAGLGLSAWIYLGAGAAGRPERAAQLLWILVVGGLVTHFLKHGAHTPRPLAALGDSAVNVVGEALRTQSMPSGHSAMAGALLALMISERRALDERSAVGGPLATTPGLLLLGVFALGIALSRLAVGAHWPADALVGAGLGLIFGTLAPRAWGVGALTRLLQRPVGSGLVAAGFVLSAVFIGATPGLLEAAGLEGTKFAHQAATGYPLAAPLQILLALVALAGAWDWARAALGRPARAG